MRFLVRLTPVVFACVNSRIGRTSYLFVARSNLTALPNDDKYVFFCFVLYLCWRCRNSGILNLSVRRKRAGFRMSVHQFAVTLYEIGTFSYENQHSKLLQSTEFRTIPRSFTTVTWLTSLIKTILHAVTSHITYLLLGYFMLTFFSVR